MAEKAVTLRQEHDSVTVVDHYGSSIEIHTTRNGTMTSTIQFTGRERSYKELFVMAESEIDSWN